MEKDQTEHTEITENRDEVLMDENVETEMDEISTDENIDIDSDEVLMDEKIEAEIEKEAEFSSSILLKGATILAVAGLISKVFGAIFRIPLTNMIGMEGQSYYSAAYPVYQLFYTIATAGFPVAISRMVSERIARGDYINAHKSYKLALKVSTMLGVISFAIMYLGAGALANFYKNPGAEMSMKAVSFALLFTPLLASLRGYYQGRQEMRPTAATEVIEQFARVIVGLSLAYAFYKTSLENAAAGATFGASFGVMVALALMFVFYRRDKKEREALKAKSIRHKEDDKFRLKEIFRLAIPITIGSAIMPIMFNIDTVIVIRRLVATGWSQPEARDLFGLMGGYCDPIAGMPFVFIDAICISMMPAITAAFTLKHKAALDDHVKTGLKTMMIITYPCTIGLLVLAKPILTMLYPRKIEEAIMAVPPMRILALTIVTLAIMRALSTSLQGIGKVTLPVINLFIGAVVKAVVSYVLVGIPAININGAATGSVVAYVVAGLLNYIALKKYANVTLDMKSIFLKPLSASLIMGVATAIIYKALFAVLHSNGIATVLTILAAVVIYFVATFKTRALTKEEVELIPKGDVLYKFAVKMKIAE